MPRKSVDQNTINTAERIYDWLKRSGADDRNIRSRKEVLEKTGIREEALDESMKYLKSRGLVSQNRGAYAIIREKRSDDFPKPITAAEQVYGKPLA